MEPRRFWTYILTNWNKTVLYTGITNNLSVRLIEHWIGLDGNFTTKYKVHYLVWSEETKYVLNAIELEKSLKNLNKDLKRKLVSDANPAWLFRNSDVLGNWPPTDAQLANVEERWRKEKEGLIDDPLSFLRQKQVADGYSRG